MKKKQINKKKIIKMETPTVEIKEATKEEITRANLVHQWKVLICKKETGKAELIRKQLTKIQEVV